MLTSSTGRVRVVHGDDLLYRFFQDVLTEEPELFAKVPQMMIQAMAIWFPLDIYREWPIVLPWVVRDPKCRGSVSKGLKDEWGAPDRHGFLRDDNSLVKSLPRSLPVRASHTGRLRGAQMGTEFVAAHVWRVVNHTLLASRVPLLNSFVPNLVWLPSQVAKLTDREGGIVQSTLQAMSFAIYRSAPVAPHLREVSEEAWSLVPEPTAPCAPVGELNWFQATEQFFSTRRSRFASVVRALEDLDAGRPLTGKVVTSRYTEGLPLVPATSRRELLAYLRRFEPADH